MKLLIGCPVYNRGWITPYWFKKIEQQDWPKEDIGFCFVYGPSEDNTLLSLLQYKDSHPESFIFEIMTDSNNDHKTHSPSGTRFWNVERYQSMTRMRNRLLERVSIINPDLFLSLDSDLLLESPDALRRLADATQEYDLVGLLTFMVRPPTEGFPSVMNWDHEVGGHAQRRHPYPIGTLFPADIVMAGKMMVPEVYRKVRYTPHPQGEDLGFCTQATKLGFKIGCESRVFASHVMGEDLLQSYLDEGDPRQPQPTIANVI